MPVSAATKADASSARRALQAADNLAAARRHGLGVGLPRREALWKGLLGRVRRRRRQARVRLVEGPLLLGVDLRGASRRRRPSPASTPSAS